MDVFNTKKLIFLIFFIFGSNLFGQGSLQGVVKDSISQDALVGANISLVGTGFGSAADIEGEYNISRIPFGSYTVRFSYIGYKTKDIKVSIDNSKGQVKLNVQLVPDVVIGEEVLVSAQALGQAAAINQQLNSNTIINVVSEEKIQELPDANAAEAIGRLPGVSITREGGEANKAVLRGLSAKFSLVTIDGVRVPPTDATDRGVDLSTISQGTLSGIELYKALTPDKDADAIAGAINLVTKAAPSKRYFRIDVKGGYNALEESVNQYNFDGRYGERFFNDVLGVQVTGNLERTIRSHENYEYSYNQNINNYSDYQISNFEVRYQNELRKRGGASLLLDFDTPDEGSIRFNNVFSQTSREYLQHQRNYAPGGGVSYNFQDNENKIKTFNSNLRGENHLFGLDASWGLSYSQSKSNDPLDWETNWVENSTSVNGKVISGMDNVPKDLLKGPTKDWIPYALNNFQIASFDNAQDQKRNNFQKNHTAFFDLLRDYYINNTITGSFKLGGKFRDAVRDHAESEVRSPYYLNSVYTYIKNADGTFSPNDFSGTIFSGLEGAKSVPLSYFLGSNADSRDIYDKYIVNPLIDKDAMELWRNLNLNAYATTNGDPQSAQFLYNFLSHRDDYYLTERVYSGYLMNTLNFGKAFTLIAGARIEEDDNDYTGQYSLSTIATPIVVPSKGELTPITVGHKETNIFPNVQTIIRPTEFLECEIGRL